MDIEVKIGEVVTGNDKDNLMASGVGSCLIITLYDPGLKIGGLAHGMLPSQDNKKKPDTKYIDTAITELIKRMLAQGAKKKDLDAKIIGGANMFPSLSSDIGKRNALGAKEKLKEEGITLVGECIGGSQGRSVEFSVASGIVTVKIKF